MKTKTKRKAVKLSLEQKIDNLRDDLIKEIELLKSVVHKCTSELDFSAMWERNIRNDIKENNLQIVETNKKIDTLIINLEAAGH